MINATQKKLMGLVLGAIVACTVSAGAASAVTFTVSGADPYVGFMNVFNLPGDGGGYQFGSGWGTADLTAVFAGNDLTLSPAFVNDVNPYWYLPAGGPGSTGNKIMEANMYVEPAGSLPGQTVTFVGTVLANSLTAAHVAKVFVRDFAPDFSSVNESAMVLPTSGSFSVTLNTINDPARHVQYGFQMKGPDVWSTDLAPFGSVTVGPFAPSPVAKTTWGGLKALYR